MISFSVINIMPPANNGALINRPQAQTIGSFRCDFFFSFCVRNVPNGTPIMPEIIVIAPNRRDTLQIWNGFFFWSFMMYGLVFIVLFFFFFFIQQVLKKSICLFFCCFRWKDFQSSSIQYTCNSGRLASCKTWKRKNKNKRIAVWYVQLYTLLFIRFSATRFRTIN